MDNLLSVSLDLPVVDISCKCSHTICGLLWPVLLLSITFSRLIHVVLIVWSVLLSFLLSNNIPLYGYTTLFIHSSAKGHLGFHFGLLWVRLLWTFMYKVLCGHLFKFSVYISRDRIAGSYGNSMFNHLSNCQAVFQSDCTILHSHHQGMNVPISPHLHQQLLLSVFFITAILVGVNLWFWCVFSLVENDVEDLFMHLWGICISSLDKCLFKSLAHCFHWIDSVEWFRLMYSRYKFFMICKNSFPLGGLSFYFIDGTLWSTFFHFDDVQIVYSFSYCLLFWEGLPMWH